MSIHQYQAAIREEKHKAILEGALQNFLEKGYTATSVGEISLSASVSLATLYKHYRTKEELFCSAVDEAWQKHKSSFLLPYDDSSSLYELFKEITHYYISFIHQQEIRQLISLCILSKDLPEPMGQRVYEALIEPTRQHLQAIAMPYFQRSELEMRVRQLMAGLNDMLVWPLFMLSLKEIPQESIHKVIDFAVNDFCQSAS